MGIFNRKKKASGVSMVSEEFGFAMEYVERYLENEPYNNSKIVFLDFILNVIKEDLKYDLISHILYAKEHFDRNLKYPLPHFYCDAQGNEKSIAELGRTEIDLAKDCVLLLPWNRERLYNQIKNIFYNEFRHDRNNHWGYYYPYLKVCHVYNGIHSVTAGVIHKKGTINVMALDITEIFPYIYTDGSSWYNTFDNKKRVDVTDFRLAILYEVAKIKYKFENL